MNYQYQDIDNFDIYFYFDICNRGHQSIDPVVLGSEIGNHDFKGKTVPRQDDVLSVSHLRANYPITSLYQKHWRHLKNSTKNDCNSGPNMQRRKVIQLYLCFKVLDLLILLKSIKKEHQKRELFFFKTQNVLLLLSRTCNLKDRETDCHKNYYFFLHRWGRNQL